MTKFSFPRKLRLLTSSHFFYVFQRPESIITPKITILGRVNGLEYPRIGLIITKKNINRAHERNRIKRLIRESFRLKQYNLPSMDFVIIVKTEIIKFNNHILLKELEKLWRHYCLLSRGVS